MNYDELLQDYRVFYEGLPDPVFYKYFYPSWNPAWSKGNTLRELFFYMRGLKKDKADDDQHFDTYSEKLILETGEIANIYEIDLRDLLNKVWRATDHNKQTGIAVIPSSDATTTNRITELVRRVLQSRAGIFKDLTSNIYRASSKEKSHYGGGRSVEKNISTLGLRRPKDTNNLDYIVVIDDVLTSGNSFRAMTEFLRRSGYKGQIINFAYARHLPSVVAETYLTFARDIEFGYFPVTQEYRIKQPKNSTYIRDLNAINGIIYDLDQTLLEDTIRDIEYENDPTRVYHAPYAPYSSVYDLMHLPVESAVVSNRSQWQLNVLFQNREIGESICFPEWNDPSEKPIFSYPQILEQDNSGNEHKMNFYKPHPGSVELRGGVLYAAHKILAAQGLDTGTLIGIGNTREDIIAYKAAGVVACLGMWGMPEWLRQYAINNWDADYVFRTVDEFKNWVEVRIEHPDYLELGRSCEETDPETACKYYEKAIQYGTHVESAAFRYAYVLHDKDPENAKKYYQMAIDAGDEYGATYNLALLYENEDRKKATVLYGRSMAAGDDEMAPRKIANLIKDEDPDRAVQLLKKAAEAGNDGYLDMDIKPLIQTGIASAIELYEEYVVGKDPKKATELGRLIIDNDPDKAKALFELAIEAGDEYGATFSLAYLVSKEDPEKAYGLYERAITAGDKQSATNNLGTLIQEREPERARQLFEQAIQAGNVFYATRNLALLVKENDPTRATMLLASAAKAGNDSNIAEDMNGLFCPENRQVKMAEELYTKYVIKDDFRKSYDLALLVQNYDKEGAIRLFEKAIDAGDEYASTYSLASLIAEDDKERAKELYRRSIKAGDEAYATRNLAGLLIDEDLDAAKELLMRSIATGKDTGSLNWLGTLYIKEDLSKAEDIFKEAIEKEDLAYAGCNLAHLYLLTKPEEAKQWYEKVLYAEDPETYLGLGYLLKDTDPDRSNELLTKANESRNLYGAIRFFIEIECEVDRAATRDILKYLNEKNVNYATELLLEYLFGQNYETESKRLTFGHSKQNGALTWIKLSVDDGKVLLISEHVINIMSYCPDGIAAIWENSDINKWLNEVLYQEAFTAEEKQLIDSVGEGSSKLSCLTKEQYENLCENGTLTFENAIEAKWWLRSDQTEAMCAPYVTEHGDTALAATFIELGVRPVLCLDLNKS